LPCCVQGIDQQMNCVRNFALVITGRRFVRRSSNEAESETNLLKLQNERRKMLPFTVKTPLFRTLAVLASLFSIHVNAQSIAIPASNVLPSAAADTNKPGFLFRIHQTAGAYATSIARTESQLAGQLGDNVADPNAQGPATDVAAPADPSTAPIEFIIPTVINVNQGGGGSGGFFTPDDQMPGVPGTTGSADNMGVEILTWLDLPAGDITMGVNSDDGFRLTIGGATPVDKFATDVGSYDGGRGAADSILHFTIPQAGIYAARLLYFEGGGDASLEWFTETTDGTKILVNDVANGGVPAYYGVTTGAAAAALTKISPGIGEGGVFPNASVNLELTEGPTAITLSTVKLSLDGSPVAATVTKSGKAISISFTPAALFVSGSAHTILLNYTEGSATKSLTWNFTVANYGTLKASDKVVADTSKPGFVWNVFANIGNTTTSNQRAEDALAGLLKDTDGNLLPNTADPAAQGAALAPAAAPSAPNATLHFEIPGVINFTQNAADDTDNRNGNFVPDLQMPGIPATDGTDGIAAEILTYIDLPAGITTMGVNSDDGFRTAAGNPQDVFGRILLGEFDAGRGAADTIFTVYVQEAGTYAFRTIWEEGGGGANIEWFTVKANGTKVLINDTANGGLKAYRALVGGTNPYIKSVSPTPLLRQYNQPFTQVSLVLADASNAIDDSSIALTFNGQPVTTTNTRSGNTVNVSFQPAGLLVPDQIQTATITFKTVGGAYTRTQTWSFMNLRQIILPTASVTENFDSYDEGTAPTGWTAVNFTTPRTPDPAADPLDDLNSDLYKNWIVVSRDRLAGLKSRIFNVAPGQTLNGDEVTVDTLSTGNLLYAESDVRGGDQVQFITSKPFDLSKITNVVLSLGSLYEQNQDSLGAIEYSVDGGNNWLPIVYYIDSIDTGGDIKYRADGTIDAVATFNAPNADTAAWVTNGIAKGDKYGDGISAPITSALDQFIAPRINDDSTIDKRLEVFRLPQAGLKSDVRLRFAQLGTGSWYFGVDNISFYDVPVVGGGTTTQPRFETATLQSGKIRIAWSGAGTLETADVVSGPWTAAADQSNPQLVSVTGGAKFFRIHKP
jgi:hypothetical protein